MKGIAKNITLGILIIMFIIGCAGSFVSAFKMTEYVTFLKAYAPLFISLIASIGVNSYKKKENTTVAREDSTTAEREDKDK